MPILICYDTVFGEVRRYERYFGVKTHTHTAEARHIFDDDRETSLEVFRLFPEPRYMLRPKAELWVVEPSA